MRERGSECGVGGGVSRAIVSRLRPVCQVFDKAVQMPIFQGGSARTPASSLADGLGAKNGPSSLNWTNCELTSVYSTMQGSYTCAGPRSRRFEAGVCHLLLR